jgi:hypothetical protein
MRPARMVVVFTILLWAATLGVAVASTTVTLTEDTQQLRDESEQCVLCHIDATAGAKIVYGGDRSQYEQASAASHDAASTPCLTCHVRHNEQGMGGSVAPKLLRVLPYQRELVADLAGGDPNAITNGTARADGWSPRDIQIAAFCSGCHATYASSSKQLIRSTAMNADGTSAGFSYYNHPMRSVRVDGPNGESAMSSAGCRMCHGAGTTDAEPGDASPNFPHSTPDAAAFLLVAPDADSPATGAASSIQDGVCLRCHRWRSGSATDGVGYDW